MKREQFEQKMQHLLLGSYDKETAQKWVTWAEECVTDEQYADFHELPREEAVCAWLDAYYASFYFIKRDFGVETVSKLVDLANVRLCLYPYEMTAAAKALSSGSGAEQIEQMIRDGLLDDGDTRTPSMNDVKRDIIQKQAKER